MNSFSIKAGVSERTLSKYDARFEEALDGIKKEGRYREFAHIERRAGHFPEALLHHLDNDGQEQIKPITVWCSNDYLGQGQNPVVLNAFKEAVDKV